MTKPEDYRHPWYLFNGHLQTVIPFLREKPDNHFYHTEILELPDGDFLELDRVNYDSRKLMIFSHGLEGNSRSYYVQESAKCFAERGWDILAWNFRSCGRMENRLPKFYRAGDSSDLELVIGHEIVKGVYDQIVLVGFSIGATMCLNLSEECQNKVQSIVCFSVPLDFKACAKRLDSIFGWPYRRQFLKKLRRKVRKKQEQNAGWLTDVQVDSIRSMRAFGLQIAMPIFGYTDEERFYEDCSSLGALESIKVPTLIINAKNDPILSRSCCPTTIKNPMVHLEYPNRGGHCGFTSITGSMIPFWIENFIQSKMAKISPQEQESIETPVK